MLFVEAVIGTILGALAWPLAERTTDESGRAMLGAVFGGVIGGALAWARAGALIATAIGAVLGASGEPASAEMEQALVNTFLQILQGAALGAIALLIISSPTRVLTGAVIGTIVGGLSGLLIESVVVGMLKVSLAAELQIAGVALLVIGVFAALSMSE